MPVNTARWCVASSGILGLVLRRGRQPWQRFVSPVAIELAEEHFPHRSGLGAAFLQKLFHLGALRVVDFAVGVFVEALQQFRAHLALGTKAVLFEILAHLGAFVVIEPAVMVFVEML